MAELIKRTKKDGKTAYLARVYCGRDKDRKLICKTKTLAPPPGMTGRKLEKELQRQADEFEREVRNGLLLYADMTLDELTDKWFEQYIDKKCKISPFCLGGVLSAMTAWGRGQAHIPRRAGGERFVMPSFPAGVCLALPVVCTVLAGSCILFMVSLESATKVRQ